MLRAGYILEVFLGCMGLIIFIAYIAQFNDHLGFIEMATFVLTCFLSIWIIHDIRKEVTKNIEKIDDNRN